MNRGRVISLPAHTLIPIQCLVFILAFSGGCEKASTKSAPPSPQRAQLELPLARAGRSSPPANAFEVSVPIAGPTTGQASLPAHIGQTVKVRAHALAPYKRLVGLLRDLSARGVTHTWIAVREANANPPQEGWIEISRFDIIDPKIVKLTFDGAPQIPWEDFLAHWAQAYETCRTVSQDCSREPEKPPRGGYLQLAFVLSQRGARLCFQQVDAPKTAKRQRVQVMDFDTQGAKAEVSMAGPKNTTLDIGEEAWFTFRARVIRENPEVIAALIGSLCASRSCNVRVAADDLTPIQQVVSMLGAAFSGQAKPPVLAFEYRP
ncbi:MAG: hypothetical protein H6714_02905 [Myxococcales bacterium]|nr:hypothetical protein [Myxococcales bacterium]